MKYIYISCYLPKKYLENYVETKKINLAAQKYHKMLIEGLINIEANPTCISLLPINRKNCTYKIIKHTKYENGRYIIPGMINFPFIKQFSIFVSCMKILYEESKHDKLNIILDGLNISGSLAAISIKKKIGAKCLAIITDMPTCLADNSLKLIRKINQIVLGKFDYYVFLTKYMNNLIKASENNYIVLEGQVDSEEGDRTKVEKDEKKIILYSGSIHKIYGIENLVLGFLQAKLNGFELHIYGDGDYREKLLDIVKENNIIKYFGVVENEQIVKQQKEAYLLVNPRPISEKYTIYSFPSKNLEYMNSGTAMMTTKLPGIPEEYNDYVYFFPSDSAEGIRNGLKHMSEMGKDDIEKRGRDAREFVQREKSKENQAQKLCSLFGQGKG